MAYLFAGAPPSWADEKLSSHLSSLSTLSLSPARSVPELAGTGKPRPEFEHALQELSSTKSPSREKLNDILSSLANPREDVGGIYVVESEMDRMLEGDIVARAVTVLWTETLHELLRAALALEEERSWWESVLNSRRGVGIYLIQTMPGRIYKALPPRSTFTLDSFTQLHRSALFPSSPSAALSAIASPYALTRREVLASRKALALARDTAAARIGTLAAQGPKWDTMTGDVDAEVTRVYSILCRVLDVSVPPTPSTRKSSSMGTSSIVTPTTLLTLLNTYIPRSRAQVDSVLDAHSRPGALTRLWFPLLFLPPTLWVVVQSIAKNKEWIKEQVRNARETAKGFVVQWVWEPLEGIGKTIRGGGEGLGVAPTTVKSDQESLERMVLDLGRDYYHMSEPQLENLGEKIRSGDMEQVLRVYEKEMQSPVKNALLGSLIRTLLIQVQKTKTDLSLSLLSLDHLLRSQQLTFAFVGVAPSVLILYGLGGWLRGVWKGEKRGKSRRRAYYTGLRDIERILITAPKKDEDMSDTCRGMLIVGVSGMRTWAAGLAGRGRQGFLDDLRMVEDPVLSRGDKLRVVERIWRCWGTDGKQRA